MRAFRTLSTLFIVLFSIRIGSADRVFSQQEALEIVKQLTSTSVKTWIDSGVIEADHQQYHAPGRYDTSEIDQMVKNEMQNYLANPNKHELTAKQQKLKRNAIPFNVRYKYLNEYTMNSQTKVIYDGDRFIWEINTLSREDSIKSVPGNSITDYFKMKWNRRRTFTWDGSRYTLYFQPVNQAQVTEVFDQMTPVVNGPLTAGIIPWGYGIYTYDNLEKCHLSATEMTEGDLSYIQLVVQTAEDMELIFQLDPPKDYAVLNYVIQKNGMYCTDISYENFVQRAGRWIPTDITIFKIDNSTPTARILSRDTWHITNIADLPDEEDFKVNYKNDALIEHRTQMIPGSSFRYRYCDPRLNDKGILIESLLDQRASAIFTQKSRTSNCATLALSYVAGQFGISLDDQNLSSVIKDVDESTSLYDLQRVASNAGLYCQAVKCDLETLWQLTDCQIILYIPGNNHFVVLGNIDNHHVRLIDLTRNHFFYRMETEQFKNLWQEGVAVIINKSLISLPEACVRIPDAEMKTIRGADECQFGCYSCTELLQNSSTIACAEPDIMGMCNGIYMIYHARYGCESLVSGTGSCIGSEMPRYSTCPCEIDAGNPSQCTLTGEWTNYYMRACD